MVVAAVPVALRKVKSDRVVEPVAKMFVLYMLVVVAKVDQREVPEPSPTKTVPLTGVEAPVPILLSIASIESLALEC